MRGAVDEGGVDGGVEVRDGFGGGGGGGEGLPVFEDEVPVASEVVPGKRTRWECRYTRAFQIPDVNTGLNVMAGSQVRGGRYEISVVSVSAAGLRRYGVGNRCADEERCSGQERR